MKRSSGFRGALAVGMLAGLAALIGPRTLALAQGENETAAEQRAIAAEKRARAAEARAAAAEARARAAEMRASRRRDSGGNGLTPQERAASRRLDEIVTDQLLRDVHRR